MYRLTLLVLGLTLALALPALAAEAGAVARPAASTPAPAPDKVYPPLPSLAMLPPASDNEELAAPRAGRVARARIKAAAAPERKSAAPVAHLVVSEASRAYLDTVGRELDQALLQLPAPALPNERRTRLASESGNHVQ
ncbi:hypothetical protein ACKI2N_027580 [Cupriavidus sp. 30B13]|uniref:hypothetical protein n=1 Tax=Cupriavidus sp. 30B13 TaxID=3384241 RepID=UPI003B8EC9EA